MGRFIDSIKKRFAFDAERDFYARHFPDLVYKIEMRFRPMTKADLKTVVAIEKSAYEFPWSLGIFRDCLKVGYCCWVGEVDGAIVAYGILSLGAGESHVMNICVAPQTQRQGYGRKMLQKLMELARQHKAEMMLLEVRPSNALALRLYRRMGFNEIGVRKGYYPSKKGREDALVLARML